LGEWGWFECQHVASDRDCVCMCIAGPGIPMDAAPRSFKSGSVTNACVDDRGATPLALPRTLFGPALGKAPMEPRAKQTGGR
jgi:hypothetical protein